MRRPNRPALRQWAPAVLAMCAAWAACAATLYRWTDANGVVHWSDRPVPGSTPVESGSAQALRQAAPAVSPNASNNQASNASRRTVLYSGIEILAPRADAVIFDSGGSVECSAQLTPSLSPGHSIWFEIDGARYDSHGALTLVVPAPRGTHVLRVLVLSADGAEQIASAPLTFHVRQASIAQPPVGPALKPKAR